MESPAQWYDCIPVLDPEKSDKAKDKTWFEKGPLWVLFSDEREPAWMFRMRAKTVQMYRFADGWNMPPKLVFLTKSGKLFQSEEKKAKAVGKEKDVFQLVPGSTLAVDVRQSDGSPFPDGLEADLFPGASCTIQYTAKTGNSVPVGYWSANNGVPPCPRRTSSRCVSASICIAATS